MSDRTSIRAAGAALLLTAAGLGAGVFTWFVSSLLIPLAYADRPVEFLFLGAPPWIALGVAVSTIVVLAVMHARLIPAIPGGRWSWRALDYAVPIALLGVAPLGAAIVLAGGDLRLAPLTYVLVDLRPWWALALLGAALLRFDRRRGNVWRTAVTATVRGWTPGRRLAIMDATLFLLLFVTAIVSSPILRFASALHGDEPKYLRLAENFYQGRGLDVAHQRPMAELTLTYSPPLWRNVVLFAQSVRQDARYLAADAHTFLAKGFGFSYNRAQFVEGWFVTGRNGGFYQVHNPGLSLLLFPAYFVDRHFIATTAGYQGVFPSALPVTDLLLLLIWSVWGVAIFRLLRAALGACLSTAHAPGSGLLALGFGRPVGVPGVSQSSDPLLGHDRLAWLLAAAALLTMPVSAFAFQIYPETTAGVIVSAACGWLLFGRPDDARLRAAVAAGAAVGFLPWLHVRFFVTSLVLIGYALLMLRRRRLPFAVGYAVMLAGICLYTYHITGSFRPDAMYESEGSTSPWRLHDALQSMLSFPLDRIWGFLPHAPVFLFALPGWAALARVQRRTAVLVALLIASLVVAASGHGFTGAGATPLRFLVAVIPLAMIPIGWTLITWGRSRAVRASFVILLIVSLDASLSYNRHHHKEVGRMIAEAISGWTPNLLFPWTHGTAWAHWPGTFALALVWVAIAATLLLLPVFLWKRWPGAVRSDQPAATRPLSIATIASAAAVFLIFATVATALGGEWTRTDYWPRLPESRLRVLAAGADMARCPACYSSFRGAIGRANLIEDTRQTFTFRAAVDDVQVGEPAVISVDAEAADGAGAGSLALDFGDGATTRVEVLGQAMVEHRYASPGLHRVSARFSAHGAPVQYRNAEVAVRADPNDVTAVDGLPPALSGAPVRGTISSLSLGAGGLTARLGDGSAPAALWLLASQGARWRAYPAEQAGAMVPGSVVAVFGVGKEEAWRTVPLTLRWPSRPLLLGAPAVMFP